MRGFRIRGLMACCALMAVAFPGASGTVELPSEAVPEPAIVFSDWGLEIRLEVPDERGREKYPAWGYFAGEDEDPGGRQLEIIMMDFPETEKKEGVSCTAVAGINKGWRIMGGDERGVSLRAEDSEGGSASHVSVDFQRFLRKNDVAWVAVFSPCRWKPSRKASWFGIRGTMAFFAGRNGDAFRKLEVRLLPGTSIPLILEDAMGGCPGERAKAVEAMLHVERVPPRGDGAALIRLRVEGPPCLFVEGMKCLSSGGDKANLQGLQNRERGKDGAFSFIRSLPEKEWTGQKVSLELRYVPGVRSVKVPVNVRGSWNGIGTERAGETEKIPAGSQGLAGENVPSGF